jgi:hypothetical protein
MLETFANGVEARILDRVAVAPDETARRSCAPAVADLHWEAGRELEGTDSHRTRSVAPRVSE